MSVGFLSVLNYDKKTISQLVWLFIIRQLATTALILMHGYHYKTQDLIILFSLMNHQFLPFLCVAATIDTRILAIWILQLLSPSSIRKGFLFSTLPLPKHFSFSPPRHMSSLLLSLPSFERLPDTLQFLLQNILRHGISKDLLRLSLLWTGMKGRYRRKTEIDISKKMILPCWNAHFMLSLF